MFDSHLFVITSPKCSVFGTIIG